MAAEKKMKGLFVVFEGGEGSGKSTQIKRLAKWLEQRGADVYTTREPGGSVLGEKLRQLVVENRAADLSDRAELLIYEASRAQLVDTVIKPKLVAGSVVLCDRFEDSSTVYQGICKGLGQRAAQNLNRFATAGLSPDLVLVLDVPETVGMQRVRQRKGEMTAWDKLDSSFHRKVRRGFLKLARANPRRYRVIDASRTEEQIETQIVNALLKRFPRRFP
jgi:dTMP kinase